MSNDDSPNVPATRDRREAVREKAQRVHVTQKRVRVARYIALGIGAVVVIGAIVTGVSVAVISQASERRLSPAASSSDGFLVTDVSGVAVSGATADPDDAEADADAATDEGEDAAATETPDATPTVDIRIYVDYLSTGAAQFQTANAGQLSRWVTEDAATVTYYPVAMLTAKSNGTKYSLRSASAAACVATYSPDTFFAYNHYLLSQQPEVDTDGMTDEELADLAQASGVQSPKRVRACIESERFVSWANDATERALEGLPDTEDLALTGTPMVLVNGTPYVGALDDPQEFAQFVLTVASDAYYTTPSPTPSSTDSATPTPTASE